MAIPPTAGAMALLPPGRHGATLVEVHAAFVSNAPFSAERQRIFDAFTLWVDQLRSLIPTGKLWVNGGFVTHKSWAAPKDIDVVLLCKPDDVNALSLADKALLATLLTQHGAGGFRKQPMGGLVDGFLTFKGDTIKTVEWLTQWSGVTDQHHNQIVGMTKGFLEVDL